METMVRKLGRLFFAMVMVVSFVPVATAQVTPAWLDYEAFFREDVGRLDAAALTLYDAPHRLWSDSDVSALVLYKGVLRDGVDLARVAWTSSLYLFLSGASNFPPDVLEDLPLSLFQENREGFLVPRHASLAEAYGISVAAGAKTGELFAAVPTLIVEEYTRQVQTGETSVDWQVLDLLFGMAFRELHIGAMELREEVGAKWLARHPGLLQEHMPTLVGVKRPGRFFLLGYTLREFPEEVYPAVMRPLDSEVREVAERAIRRGYTGDYATYLLSDERPLGVTSARTVFESRCAAGEWERCGEFVARLFAGPDDAALKGIRREVEAWIVGSLVEGATAMEFGCRLRDAVLSAPGGGDAGGVGVRGELRRLGGSIQRGSQRVTSALDIALRLDEPSTEVVEAVYEYWYRDRDPEAERFLQRHGGLGAAAQSQLRHGIGPGRCLGRGGNSGSFLE